MRGKIGGGIGNTVNRIDSTAGTGYSTITSSRDVNKFTGRNRVINVFCAGDDDQSIYAWRGAQVDLMRRFQYDFPGIKVSWEILIGEC